MYTLLVIDDDEPTRQLLTSIFESEFKILQAADGVKGLRLMLDHLPDIVILDVSMPRLDGLSVLEVMKSDPKLKATLVVMLTARGQYADLDKGMTLGADAYFIKPFNAKTLKTWIFKNMGVEER